MRLGVLSLSDTANHKSKKSYDLLARKIKETIKTPCQRILLIHPMHIVEDNFYLDRALARRYWAYQPYGCGVLCRNLNARGYTTDILDLNFEVLSSAHALKDNFSYKIWEEKLLAKLKTFRPDFIGISCMFSMSHEIIKHISQKIKEYDPKLAIIIGGVHPSNASHLVLKDWPEIDFIGPFEGDRSLPDLVDFVNGKLLPESITQVATMINGKYVSVDRLARPQPSEIEIIPLYHSLPIGEYNDVGQIGSYTFLRQGRKAASILTNRGCRYHCSFCSVPQFNGTGVRGRSVDSVLDEIQELQEKYGIQHIDWLDDDLLSNRKRALALFNSIAKRNLDLTWSGSNGLVAASITPEVMQAMVESGCIGFNLGIESGTSEILRSVHKPGTVDSFKKCKKILDLYPHVFIKGFMIVGFPGETMGQIQNTIDLCIELDLDWYALQMLNLLPSTEIYQNLLRQDQIEDNIQTSDVAYIFGPSGQQRRREREEKKSAREFHDLLANCDPDTVPDKAQLVDCAFLVDYRINYWKILRMANPIKLRKATAILNDICERIAPDSAFAHLFLGVAEQKLGNFSESQRQARITNNLISESAYWSKRFEVLDLYPVIESLEI